MTESIMITGSSGNIGNELIMQLLNSNSEITFRAAVRSVGNRVNNDNDLESVQQVELDLSGEIGTRPKLAYV